MRVTAVLHNTGFIEPACIWCLRAPGKHRVQAGGQQQRAGEILDEKLCATRKFFPVLIRKGSAACEERSVSQPRRPCCDTDLSSWKNIFMFVYWKRQRASSGPHVDLIKTNENHPFALST